MPILGARHDNEQNSYVLVDDNGNNVAQRVKPVGLGSLLEGVVFDYLSASYPTSNSEVYTYKNGGSGGTTVATITVNYTDDSKKNISSVSRS